MDRGKLRTLAITLGVFTIISGLMAYFTSGDVVTNSFSASTLQIKIIEPSWKPNQVIVPEQKVDKDPYIVNIDEVPAYVFMQVTVPAREIVVEENTDGNKGKKITSNSTITDDDGSIATVTHNTHTVPLFRFINSAESYTSDQLSSEQKHNTGWYYMTTTENKNSSGKVISYTYLYAWTGDNSDDTMAIVYPSQTTNTPLFNKVIFCNAREDDSLSGSLQNIEIKAFAIQTDYLKSSEETESKAENVWQYLSK
mgnify:FL=1